MMETFMDKGSELRAKAHWSANIIIQTIQGWLDLW